MLITDKGCKPRNCNSCKFHYSAENYHYKLKEVEHKKMDGFICAAFVLEICAAFVLEEGTMVYMSGLVNDSVDFCEMYQERGQK